MASGVRRIEGVTGRGVLQHMAEDAKTIQDASSALKLNNPAELPEACEHLLSEQKELRRELEKQMPGLPIGRWTACSTVLKW